jgi:Fe-S oxidoreductase
LHIAELLDRALSAGDQTESRNQLQRKAPGAERQGVSQRAGQGENHNGGDRLGERIWSCTTCYACVETCPVAINPTSMTTEIRRQLVEQGELPVTAARSLEKTIQLGNPWGEPRSRRTAWIGSLPVRILQPGDEVEYLYWVGDIGSFDAEAQAISRAMVQVLQLAGVHFGILGTAEQSDGEAARRLGEEGLFNLIARQNIELLKEYRFKTILTHCPHTYNTLKKEYPEIGGKVQVIHHTQFLNDLVRNGVIQPTRPIGHRVTYHDPCYLGRHNQIYAEPRELLQSLPGLELVEMEHTREKALCCGAGGGMAWIDVANGPRLSLLRMEDVENVRVRTVATACPYCKMMLCDAASSKQMAAKIEVKDISELLLETQPKGI